MKQKPCEQTSPRRHGFVSSQARVQVLPLKPSDTRKPRGARPVRARDDWRRSVRRPIVNRAVLSGFPVAIR